MNRKLKIFIVVLTILVVITAIALYYYFGASYKYFKSIGTQECKIPGLNEGFTPQGLSYDEESDGFIISGYMKNEEEPSRIYLASGENYSQLKYVTLKLDSEDFVGHSNGVAVYQSNIFIASEGKIYRISKEDIYNAENKTSISILDYFETKNGADFVTVNGNELWVGEFYHGGNFETPESHKYETSEGNENNALAFCYTLNTDNQYGVESTLPSKALSLPAITQGMDFYSDGKIALSTSYSIPDSKIYIYQNIFSETAEAEFEYDNENQIPVYVLSSSNLVKDFSMPCMSEEIVIKNDKIFVLFASASQKYRLFTRTRMDYIYSLNVKFE